MGPPKIFITGAVSIHTPPHSYSIPRQTTKHSLIPLYPTRLIHPQTGYVGGDVLHALLQSHPTWESSITCLYRTPSSISTLTATYPSIKTVQGTLDSATILQDEAANADIVLHFASSDHVGAAEAIKAGLLKGKGGTWIHTSGTDLLLNPRLLKGERDVEPKEIKVFDDWEGLDEVISFPGKNAPFPFTPHPPFPMKT